MLNLKRWWRKWGEGVWEEGVRGVEGREEIGEKGVGVKGREKFVVKGIERWWRRGLWRRSIWRWQSIS